MDEKKTGEDKDHFRDLFSDLYAQGLITETEYEDDVRLVENAKDPGELLPLIKELKERLRIPEKRPGDGEIQEIRISMGDIKKRHEPWLRSDRVSVSLSFSNGRLELWQIREYKDLSIDVDLNFSTLVLYVPAGTRVEESVDNSMSTYKCDRKVTEDSYPESYRLRLTGTMKGGTLKVKQLG